MMNSAFRARTLLLLATALSGCHLVVDFDAARIGADASTDSGSVTQDMGVIVVDGGDADVDDAEIDMGDVDMDVADMGDVDMGTVDMGAIDMDVPDMTVAVDMTTPDMCTPTTFYRDADEDGAGDPFVTMSACDAPSGYVANDDDCDDDDDAVYGGATEVCDGKDNDCDLDIDEGVKTTFYPDADEDTYGNSTAPTEACTAPAQHVTIGGDCDDDNADVHPGATELCDDVDNDCDAGTADGSGEPTFGDSCDESDDGTCGGTIICGGEGLECSVHPSPGFCYDDGDNDSFGDASSAKLSCACEDNGGVSNGLDCDPSNGARYPGASEVCDGVQNDCDASVSIDDGADEGVGNACSGDECSGVLACDGTSMYCDAPDQTSWYLDADRDGYGSNDPNHETLACADPSDSFLSYSETNDDCNDGSMSVYPGASITCPAANPVIDMDCDETPDQLECP